MWYLIRATNKILHLYLVPKLPRTYFKLLLLLLQTYDQAWPSFFVLCSFLGSFPFFGKTCLRNFRQEKWHQLIPSLLVLWICHKMLFVDLIIFLFTLSYWHLYFYYNPNQMRASTYRYALFLNGPSLSKKL